MAIPLSIPYLGVRLGCLDPLSPTCGPWEARGQGDTTDRQVFRDPEDPQQQDPPCPSWAPFCLHFQRPLCSVWFRKGARETYAESCEESPSSPSACGGRGGHSLGGQQGRQPSFPDQEIQVLGRLEELGRGADKPDYSCFHARLDGRPRQPATVLMPDLFNIFTLTLPLTSSTFVRTWVCLMLPPTICRPLLPNSRCF